MVWGLHVAECHAVPLPFPEALSPLSCAAVHASLNLRLFEAGPHQVPRAAGSTFLLPQETEGLGHRVATHMCPSTWAAPGRLWVLNRRRPLLWPWAAAVGRCWPALSPLALSPRQPAYSLSFRVLGAV